MIGLRLVVDTNVLISAALKPESLQRTVIIIAITKPARLYVSQPVLEEYAQVLARPEFRIRKGMRQQLFQLIRNRAVVVSPRIHLSDAGDPDDDKFIEGADAARADYLITGNRRHFPRYWKSTKVVTPREFMELAAPHLPGK
jgi:putative PIN family toxin of toxin-antitoxin system